MTTPRTMAWTLTVLLLASAAAQAASLSFYITDTVVATLSEQGRLRVGVAGEGEVVYDPSQEHVVSIAGVAIQYDSTFNRIVQVGDQVVRYDDSLSRVLSVGEVEVGYDAQNQRVLKVGGVNLTYDGTGQRVVATSGSVGVRSFLSPR